MDAALKEDFQFYKILGLVVSLVLVLGFQILFPNRLGLRSLIANWKVNIPLTLINSLLFSLLCGACVCTWAIFVREQELGVFVAGKIPYWLQVIATVVLLDFVAYAWHRANHRWAFLWRFHAVHHSDVHFEATTGFRFHPGELLISLGVRLVVVTITGLPLLGLIAFEILFAFCNLFVHSDTRLPKALERVISWVFITPSLHRMHHSDRPTQLNRNFGTIFSIWDRVAKTVLWADADTPISVGLPGQNGKALPLTDTMLLPLRKDDQGGSASR